MKADAKTRDEVMAVLRRWSEAIKNRDMNALALFAPDPDTVVIGTGADEKAIGHAEIKALIERARSQSQAASAEYRWTSISAAGSVAWAAADAAVHAKVGGREVSFPMRITLVLEKRGKKWVITQYHGSLPAAGQAEGQSWPTQPR